MEASELLNAETVTTSPSQPPGFQTIAILEPFTQEELDENLLPSSNYGSDHVLIAADFQLLW